MSTMLDIPPPTHREQKPIRACSNCGAYLRSGNERDVCDPCWAPDPVDDLIEQIERARLEDILQSLAAEWCV